MLVLTVLVALFSFGFGITGEVDNVFGVVVYICVWQRPQLTNFVLSHFHSLRSPLRERNIDLQLFIAGSENSTIATASRFDAGHIIVPNSPLGAKHEKGLQAIREHFKKQMQAGTRSFLPHAVTVFGSDDVVNEQFFILMKKLMFDHWNACHVLGLRDLYFMDLKTKRLVYTRGYRSFQTPLAGTLGCGRVYSWKLLETLNWRLWDPDRERGLDQSATRNVLRRLSMVGEISRALVGKEEGVAAIDIKTDSFTRGRNIWGFDQVVKAVGKNGRFHEFEDGDFDLTIGRAFGTSMLKGIEELRTAMDNEGDTD